MEKINLNGENLNNRQKMKYHKALKLNLRAYKILWEKNSKLIISTVLVQITNSTIPYVGIYITARLINEIADNRNHETLIKLVLISMVSVAVTTLFSAVITRWSNYHSARMGYDCEKIYTDKLLSVDFSSIDDPYIHNLRSQIMNSNSIGGWGLSRVLGSINSIIASIASIIGAVILTTPLFIEKVPDDSGYLTIINNPMFITLLISIMIVITFIAPMCTSKAGSYWVKWAEDEGDKGNRFFEFFGFAGYNRSNALDIRMYRQDIIYDQTFINDEEFKNSKISRNQRGPIGGFNALATAVWYIFTGLVYIFVCLKAWDGAFGIGSVTQYIGSTLALSAGVSLLFSSLGDMRNNAAFLQTTFEFLDIPNNMYQGSMALEKNSSKKYVLEFCNVSFKYPKNKQFALKNVSMKFQEGKKLAIVGMNGSGKTTLIKLLCRLYDPTEGEILLNGVNIKEYNYNEYMSIFSVVFQDYKLIAASLGQNVAAKTEYEKDRVEDCLVKAGFNERLSKMQMGLDTNIYKDFDEEGVEISGGEAQKIAIARSIYKDSAFIIFDEPTAALDPIAEHEVYSRMNDIISNKTTIFISHRLSSCKLCDDIAVFHEGELVQRGCHDELILDVKGKYYELWNAQAQFYC